MEALLTLEDGFSLRGHSFTGPIDSQTTIHGGEVIFNTGMTGYQEILTDPSYCGQMVCLTYPLIGNYGINPWDYESPKVQVAALLVKECCKEPSNWQATESLPEFLKRHGVPGVEGLDTRALTLHLRKHGAMRGAISTSILNPEELRKKALELPEMAGQNLVPKVAPKKPYRFDVEAEKRGESPLKWLEKPSWENTGKKRVLVYDFGIKWSILRLLLAEGHDIIMVPPTFGVADVETLKPDGIFLSNGPGDPATLKAEIAIITELVKKYPTAGICLGHQLLGHALGGTTEKLKFGHHGCNHPVKDLETGRIEISSQNHGFHVIHKDLVPTHINLNDQTLEGFKHPTLPVIAVQHHPEAAPGPTDCQTFFGKFTRLLCA